MRFKFQFRRAEEAEFPWVRFKDLVFSNQIRRELIDSYTEDEELSPEDEDRVGDNIDRVTQAFKTNETITYQELDSIDNPSLYTEDDVVEVFIRANSGGTRLGKSDLLFSLLSSTRSNADDRMEELLSSLNAHGFAFDRDFIMKTCLVLLDQWSRGTRSRSSASKASVNRSRDAGTTSPARSPMCSTSFGARPTSSATRPCPVTSS